MWAYRGAKGVRGGTDKETQMNRWDTKIVRWTDIWGTWTDRWVYTHRCTDEMDNIRLGAQRGERIHKWTARWTNRVQGGKDGVPK